MSNKAHAPLFVWGNGYTCVHREVGGGFQLGLIICIRNAVPHLLDDGSHYFMASMCSLSLAHVQSMFWQSNLRNRPKKKKKKGVGGGVTNKGSYPRPKLDRSRGDADRRCIKTLSKKKKKKGTSRLGDATARQRWHNADRCVLLSRIAATTPLNYE